MTLLVTGGQGFTGRYLVPLALEAGYRVHELRADLTDAAAVAREVAQVEPARVVHLAAIGYVGHADERAFYDVNLFGTLNLLDALRGLARRPAKVLLASSANVYGNAEVSPIGEEQAPAPVNHYAMSKLAMEMMAGNFAAALPIAITRPFNYTGPGQGAEFLIPKLVSHFARRAPVVELGNLGVEREFNDVRFVCGAYLRLLEAGVPGEKYNVCSGAPVSLGTVIDLLSSITGHRIEVRVNPGFVRPNEVHRLCGDPSKLHAAIGRVTSPPLAETLEWMLEEASAARQPA